MSLSGWIIAGGAVAFIFYFLGKDEQEGKKSGDDKIPTIIIGPSEQRKDSYDDYDPPEIDYYWDDDYGFVPVNAKLQITYSDAKGQLTKRTITVSEYDGSAYLEGFCELRNEPRTFRIDRIQEAIDAESGEVITSVPQHLLNKYKQSPEYIISNTIDTYMDVFKVLFYVGKADGQLRAPEREIICATVRTIAKNKTLSYEDINKFINRLEIPTLHGFKLAFGRICKSYPKQTPQIYAIAKKIVDTQKTVHPHEKEALEYMERKMQKEGIAIQTGFTTRKK